MTPPGHPHLCTSLPASVDLCVLPPSAPPPLQSAAGGSGGHSTYSMGNQSPQRCFTVSMSSWQRRRRLTSLRALDGTTSVIHTCRERSSVRKAANRPPPNPLSSPRTPSWHTYFLFLLLTCEAGKTGRVMPSPMDGSALSNCMKQLLSLTMIPCTRCHSRPHTADKETEAWEGLAGWRPRVPSLFT